ncbi:MAG: hypothetical protein IJ192_01745 [Clostridia bacterium]|nr:hypothetical protein [Clostridia bacterium]
MNMKDIFYPNNYTEKAMPVSTSLCRALESSGLDMMSDETKKITEEHSKLNDEFFNSLNDKQKDIYHKKFLNDSEEEAAVSHEYFNMGLCFGAMLMKELLG